MQKSEVKLSEKRQMSRHKLFATEVHLVIYVATPACAKSIDNIWISFWEIFKRHATNCFVSNSPVYCTQLSFDSGQIIILGLC